MKVIRMHDYMTYAPKDAKPNIPALRRIMYSFFVATALRSRGLHVRRRPRYRYETKSGPSEGLSTRL